MISALIGWIMTKRNLFKGGDDCFRFIQSLSKRSTWLLSCKEAKNIAWFWVTLRSHAWFEIVPTDTIPGCSKIASATCVGVWKCAASTSASSAAEEVQPLLAQGLCDVEVLIEEHGPVVPPAGTLVDCTQAIEGVVTEWSLGRDQVTGTCGRWRAAARYGDQGPPRMPLEKLGRLDQRSGSQRKWRRGMWTRIPASSIHEYSWWVFLKTKQVPMINSQPTNGGAYRTCFWSTSNEQCWTTML